MYGPIIRPRRTFFSTRTSIKPEVGVSNWATSWKSTKVGTTEILTFVVYLRVLWSSGESYLCIVSPKKRVCSRTVWMRLCLILANRKIILGKWAFFQRKCLPLERTLGVSVRTYWKKAHFARSVGVNFDNSPVRTEWEGKDGLFGLYYVYLGNTSQVELIHPLYLSYGESKSYVMDKAEWRPRFSFLCLFPAREVTTLPWGRGVT